MKRATLILASALFLSACSQARDPALDTSSDRARPAALVGPGEELVLPAVQIDARGFRQTWGVSQSSLELADYIHELKRSVDVIESMSGAAPAWQRLAQTFRQEAVEKLLALTSAPGTVSQADGILLPIAAAEGYAAAYRTSFNEKRGEEFEKNVRDIPLPALFDALIEGIRDGSLKGKLSEVGVDESEIPMRLVRKASRARGDKGCALNAEEKAPRKPGFFKKIWAYFGSNCYVRRLMYTMVKDKLIDAKRSPAVQKILAEEFEKRFPEAFKEGFREGFSKALAETHLTLQRKVDPAATHDQFLRFSFLEPYWSAGGGEGGNENGTRRISLEQLGLTLGAQIGVAADLLDGTDRGGRLAGLATAYGALEKMLFLLGREGAVTRDGLVQTRPLDPEATRQGVPPEVVTELKGGAAYNPATKRLERWDPEQDLKAGAAPKLYPDWVEIDRRGNLSRAPQATPASRLATLTALIDGALSFVEVTGSGRTIALKFAEAARVLKAEDTGALFPAELRDAPLGIIATALKTLVGRHLVALDADGKPLPSLESPGVAGLAFLEADADETGRALIVLARLARALRADPLARRAELDEVRRHLDFALPLVALNYGKALQREDGGFESASGRRTLGTQAVALAAHLEVYRLHGTPALAARALRVLGFLKSTSMWSERSRFFRSSENTVESQFLAADLLRLMTACLQFRDVTGVLEQQTQALALASRIAEFLGEAGIRKEFETLGLMTP